MKCYLSFTRKDWPTWTIFIGKFKMSSHADECVFEWDDPVDEHKNTSAWLLCMINNLDLSFGRLRVMLGNCEQELKKFISSSQHLNFVESERIKLLEYDRQELIEREIIERGGAERELLLEQTYDTREQIIQARIERKPRVRFTV